MCVEYLGASSTRRWCVEAVSHACARDEGYRAAVCTYCYGASACFLFAARLSCMHCAEAGRRQFTRGRNAYEWSS
jgi:hypothetical protein